MNAQQAAAAGDVVVEKLGGEKSKLDETTKNCVHEVVRPAAWVSKPLEAHEPARKFAYPLDPFQKTAIECIEINESVLVAAHTSAGKTTVAEYAIALALKNRSRVIYTAPIKALSNQKFRDLQEQFLDVGLMTGDVTLNPNASVIIMTTEILRSILYRGSELVREVKWVIFDEIHYMRDRDRGVIWEETIVLLPDSVRQVFLSATVPNTLEFAEWICRTKHQPCHVVSTNFRPTPLQHYLFPAGGEGLTMVMNEHRQFQEDNYKQVVKQLENVALDPGKPKKRRAQPGAPGEDDLERILSMCSEKNFAPVIVFAFSKKEVEENAGLISNLDMTTAQEKADIQKIYNSAIVTLSDEDRTLPQVTNILPHLLRGIGIHHGGLLPIVKEITEILFQELLIKVLFSTETFSMGINMPARTVIFTGLHKYDGQTQRMISPGEYIQMSGRAGRRGIDTKGFSIVMLKSKPEDEDQLRQLFTGEAFRLDSHFYMKYNTILNLTRVEGADPEYMIKRSFLQFQNQRNTVSLEERIRTMEKQLEAETMDLILKNLCTKLQFDDWRQILPVALRSEDEDSIECAIVDFCDLCAAWRRHHMQLREEMNHSSAAVARHLVRGRVVRVVERSTKPGASPKDDRHWGYGAVTNLVTKRGQPGADPDIFVDVVLRVATAATRGRVITLEEMEPHPSGGVERVVLYGDNNPIELESAQFETFRVPLHCIADITRVRCKFDEADVSEKQSEEFRTRIGAKVMSLIKKQPVLSILDPIHEMQLPDSNELAIAFNGLTQSETGLKASPLFGWTWTEQIVNAYQERVELANNIQTCQSQLQAAQHPKNVVQLQYMTEVLRRLEYLDRHDIITVKGRVCCDLSTVDTLVMGELLFGYSEMQALPPQYLCALLSTLVHEEPSKQVVELKDPRLQSLFDVVLKTATRVAELSQQCGLDFDKAAYLAKFTPVLMEPARDWVLNKSFGEIMRNNRHLYEGSVVRSFRRLEEALRECAACAHAMGSQTLEDLFVGALKEHRKGIIFQASLYL